MTRLWGLEFHDDALTVNGAPFRAVPEGILVEGSSWVPVGSIADAFGADTSTKRDLGPHHQSRPRRSLRPPLLRRRSQRREKWARTQVKTRAKT